MSINKTDLDNHITAQDESEDMELLLRVSRYKLATDLGTISKRLMDDDYFTTGRLKTMLNHAQQHIERVRQEHGV